MFGAISDLANVARVWGLLSAVSGVISWLVVAVVCVFVFSTPAKAGDEKAAWGWSSAPKVVYPVQAARLKAVCPTCGNLCECQGTCPGACPVKPAAKAVTIPAQKSEPEYMWVNVNGQWVLGKVVSRTVGQPVTPSTQSVQTSPTVVGSACPTCSGGSCASPSTTGGARRLLDRWR